MNKILITILLLISTNLVIDNVYATCPSGFTCYEVSTSNLGINTASPTANLGVGGNAEIGGVTYTNAASPPTNGLIVQGNTGIGSITPGQALDVQGTVRALAHSVFGGTSSQFQKGDGSLDSTSYYAASNPSNYLATVTANSPLGGSGTVGSPLIFTNPGYISSIAPITLSSPNVGIGSTAPGQVLDVNGTVRVIGNGVFSGSGTGLTGVLLSTGATTGATSQSQTFTNGVTVSASNIVTDTSTGTKIGTSTSQKLGFFNSTPIAQPSGDLLTAFNTSNLGLVASPSLTQADINGLTTGSSPTFTGLTLSGQTSGGNQCAQFNSSGTLSGTGSTCGSGGGGGNPGGSATNLQYQVNSTTFGGVSNSSVVSGNIGLGSANPGQILDVTGTVRSTTLNGANGVFIANSSGIANTQGYTQSGSATNALTGATQFGSSAQGEIDGNGNLDTSGKGQFGGGTGSSSEFAVQGNAAFGSLYAGSAPANGIAVSGNVGIGSAVAQSNLYDNGNAIFVGNVGVGLNNTSFPLDVQGTITAVTIAGSGNLGIGSTAPGVSLDVQGTVRDLNETSTGTIKGVTLNGTTAVQQNGTPVVYSFSGDGLLLGNSSSTGAVTATTATQTQNTVIGAATSTTLAALSMPSCSTSSNALTWTTGTGFGCNTISGGGGSTSPGGPSGALQFNSSGVFAGANVYQDSNGNVGIGSLTPGQSLDVQGTVRFLKTNSTVSIGTTSTASMFNVGSSNGFQVNSSGQIASIGGGGSNSGMGSNYLNFSAGSGNVTITNNTANNSSTLLLQASGGTTGEDLTLEDSNSASAVASNYVRIVAGGGSERFRVDGTGNVGINSVNPNSLLDVEGTVKPITFFSSIPASGIESNVGIGTFLPKATFDVEGTVNPVVFFAATSSNQNVGIGTFNPPQTLSISGVIGFKQNSPTITSCGSTPNGSVVGSDAAGTITVGGTATGCTLSFKGTYAKSPHCTFSNQSMSVINAMTYTESTSGFTLSQTGLGGDLIDYHCTFDN